MCIFLLFSTTGSLLALDLSVLQVCVAHRSGPGVCLPSVEIPAAYVACVMDKVLAYKESCRPCVCPFICQHKPQFCNTCNNGWVPTLITLNF